MENKKWMLGFIPVLIIMFYCQNHALSNKEYHMIDAGFCDLYRLVHENHKELIAAIEELKANR